MTIQNRHKKTQIITNRREMPLKQSKGSQIVNLFMQNKPNLLNAQISVTSFLTSYYEDFRPYGHSQNKPNQTQFQSQLNPIKPQKTQFQTQTNPNKPNSKPISNLLPAKSYEENYCL